MSVACSSCRCTAAASATPIAPDPQQRSIATPPGGVSPAARAIRNSVRRRGTNTPGSTAIRRPQNSAQPSTCSSGRPATRRSTSAANSASSRAAEASSRASSSAKTQPAARSLATMPGSVAILLVLIVVEQLDVFLLAAQRRQVKEDLGFAQQVADGAVAGPGVQYGVAVAPEDADAALLAGPGGPGLAPGDQLPHGPEVVLDRRDALVLRHVEVVIEVASVRRIPREAPAHPPPERLDLADRRP